MCQAWKTVEKGPKKAKKYIFLDHIFCRFYFIGFQDSLALSNIFEKSSFDHFAVNKYTFRKKTADVYWSQVELGSEKIST